MKGFLAESTLISKPPPSLVAKCGACGLYRGCQTPKMPVNGKGRRKVLIVGEVPGAQEDEEGIQFVGKAGKYLRDTLEEVAGIDLEEDCWTTNALICRPPDNKIENESMIEWCRPNLTRTIEQLKPETIILLGASAVKSLIGGIWKENPGPMTQWAGWRIPSQRPNAWICPTYHPSYLLREHNDILEMFFKRHLKAAFEGEGRPWEVLPDYASQVEIILDPVEAARILRKMIEKGGTVAVDYENTCLKPEYEGAEIVCCSVCWEGKKTISYPWHGEAITATIELLHSDRIRCIAANLKHEDRWTRKVAGKGVRNWIWDTMIGAHVLDNRRGICGLKFQAFIHLGAEAYDDAIKPFLAAVGDSKINKVKKEVDLRQLLLYCGVDTLLEFFLAEKQMQALGWQSDSKPLLFGDTP